MSLDQVVMKGTSVTGHTSAAATAYFGLTLNEVGVIVGICTSLLMLIVNLYFQWRRDRREQQAADKLERRKGDSK